MTQHFDEEAARRRLEAEKQRVNGLIQSLQSEGLDQEAADQDEQAQCGEQCHAERQRWIAAQIAIDGTHHARR